MMKVYEPKEMPEEGKQPWSLSLVESDKGVADIVAVDDDSGKWITYIASISGRGLAVREQAKEALSIQGYDTSLSQWSENGAIKVLS